MVTLAQKKGLLWLENGPKNGYTNGRRKIGKRQRRGEACVSELVNFVYRVNKKCEIGQFERFRSLKLEIDLKIKIR